jgi:hypothetical protein
VQAVSFLTGMRVHHVLSSHDWGIDQQMDL